MLVPQQRSFPLPKDQFELDAMLCISYFTIELRSAIPVSQGPFMGAHIFGCDICQDVCPWNSRAPLASPSRPPAPALVHFANLSDHEFHLSFQETASARPKYPGFLRNVPVAMGNSGQDRFREPLERLATQHDAMVS